MCPACLVTILAAGVGTVGGASALLWAKGRKAKPPTPNPEPPSASFKEWVVAVVSLEEALRATGNAPGAITGSRLPASSMSERT